MSGNIKLYTLYDSTNPDKKYDVYVDNPETGRIKKISFGANGYEDYSTHRDKNRRDLYRSRHAYDYINDPTKPGFWSWHVLWGSSPNINTNMAQILRRIL